MEVILTDHVDATVIDGSTDTIAEYNSAVLIGNKPAARMGDSTAHGASW